MKRHGNRWFSVEVWSSKHQQLRNFSKKTLKKGPNLFLSNSLLYPLQKWTRLTFGHTISLNDLERSSSGLEVIASRQFSAAQRNARTVHYMRPAGHHTNSLKCRIWEPLSRNVLSRAHRLPGVDAVISRGVYAVEPFWKAAHSCCLKERHFAPID